MAKSNRNGKAAIWTKPVIQYLRSQLNTPQQRLIFEISLWTGERIGAICQLKVKDVYTDSGKVKDAITFAGVTRKSSKHGQAKTRQIAVHDVLHSALKQYPLPESGYLFPSKHSKTGHISPRSVDEYWRKILVKKGYVGFSTHSSRRWVINQLFKQGKRIKVIAKAMAIDTATVERYLDDAYIEANLAIASLSV